MQSMLRLSNISVEAWNLHIRGIGFDYLRCSSSMANSSSWHFWIKVTNSSDWMILANL